MNPNLYKGPQRKGKGAFVQSNYLSNAFSEQNDIESSELTSQISNAVNSFLTGDFQVTLEAMNFLIKAIPESPNDFMIYILSNPECYFQKLFQIYNPNIKQNEIRLILQMIKMIITSEKLNSQFDLNPVLDFCIKIVQELPDGFLDNELACNIQYDLDCIILMVNNENFQKLDQTFFEKIECICFSTDEVSVNCSKLIEKMSNFIPKIHKFKYFFDFFKYMCNNLSRSFASYLYLTLRNLVKRYPEIVRVPNIKQMPPQSLKKCSLSDFWAYEMILNSYRYGYDCQSAVFEICSYLNKESLCILEDNNIKNNILSSIMKSEKDERINSAFHALCHFLNTDSKSCAEQYFSIENSTNLSPFLIKHIIDSPFNIKVDAGYLLGFAMSCEPQFFAKGFIRPYCTSASSRLYLANEEDAIVNILNFDIPDLLVKMINGLIAISIECEKWGVTDELFERLNGQIVPLLQNLVSNENNDVAALTTKLLDLITPKESEDQEQILFDQQ